MHYYFKFVYGCFFRSVSIQCRSRPKHSQRYNDTGYTHTSPIVIILHFEDDLSPVLTTDWLTGWLAYLFRDSFDHSFIDTWVIKIFNLVDGTEWRIVTEDDKLFDEKNNHYAKDCVLIFNSYMNSRKIRGSNPIGSEIYRTHPHRPWGPPCSLFNR